MSSSISRAEVLGRSFKETGSGKVYLAILMSFFGIITLILGLSDDPLETVALSEGIELAEFVWVPKPGAWLGVDIHPAPANNGASSGAFVARVLLDSPAQNAGLRAGDMIVRADGSAIQSAHDLGDVTSRHKPGDVIALAVQRRGQPFSVNVRLGSTPLGQPAAATAPADAPAPAPAPGEPWLGIDIQNINAVMRSRLGLPDNIGVIVSHVCTGSPSALAGVKQGDVIRRAGASTVNDIKQFAAIVSAGRPGNVLALTVWHQGIERNLRIVLGTRPTTKTRHAPIPGAEVEIEAAWIGLDIVPLTRAEAEELGIDGNLRGMVVDAVAAGPGADAGFQTGDVIIAVNGKPTPTVAALEDATEGAVGALVDVIRFGRHVYISIPPPDVAIGGKNRPVRQVVWGGPQ